MARDVDGRAVIVCGLLLTLLAGCGRDRPADIPRPTPGVMAWLGGGCPDLRGSYRFSPGPDKAWHPFPSVYWDTQMRRAPRHHSVWSIESLDAERMVIRTSASAQDMREGFAHWRDANKIGYQRWLAQNGAGLVPSEGPGKGYPRSSVVTIPGQYYACEGGWLVIGDSNGAPGTAVASQSWRMTAAADGGLVAQRQSTVREQSWLWCGPGCKREIRHLPRGHTSWWYAPPASPADDNPVDWAALAREARELDARRLVAWENADRQRRQRAQARAQEEQVAAVASVGFDAASQSYWRKTLQVWLAPGMQLEQVSCEGLKCRAKGSAQTTQDVSNLLRAADQAAANPEVERIEQRLDGRYSFSLMLDARAR